ncbi:hypothetical protein OHS81_13465 [Streptomyces sp. NBC_00400]|uniref:hypothetical protein n=1 Tax=Streptomyces sp. NBC_00400 TaxID=2975737 RepID=UPI002E1E4913
MTRGGQAGWNDETQRWEDGAPTPAPYTGPMPPRPSFTPSAGGPSAHPGPLPDPDAHPYPTDPYPTDPYTTTESAVTYAPGARRRTALVAGAAVAVFAAAVGSGYLLWGHGDDPAAARPPARTKSSAPSGTATAPSTGAPDSITPAPTLTDLPDGYRLAHDKKGFTLAVPGTWTRSERKDGVFYTAPDDRGLLQIFEITDPEITPREALRQASQSRSGKPGYKEISLEPLGFPGPGIDANQLVYAYDNESLGMRVKVVDCAFTAADSRQFAVLVLGAEADWPEQEVTQQIALRTFVPHT